MGGTSFSNFGEGDNPQQVYDRLVSDAVYEYGSDGYNGTISTTNGFVIATRHPVTMDEANQMASNFWDNDTEERLGISKWGPCAAVPVVEESAVVSKEVKFEVTITGALELHDARSQLQEKVSAYLAGYLANKGKPGDGVLAWDVELGQQRYDPAKSEWVTDGRSPKKKTSTSVVAPKGKTITRYFISGANLSFDPARFLTTGFGSQAEARAHVAELVKKDDRFGHATQQYSVFGVTMRESGEPLVQGKREVVETTYPILAKVGQVKAGAKVKGYLFFGIAAC